MWHSLPLVPEHCHSARIQEFSGQESWQRLFRSRLQAHSWFSSMLAIPPAGATTLIVSLGIISRPRELVIIEVAVFLLVAQALVINRLAGLPYPLWNAAASNKGVEGQPAE